MREKYMTSQEMYKYPEKNLILQTEVNKKYKYNGIFIILFNKKIGLLKR